MIGSLFGRLLAVIATILSMLWTRMRPLWVGTLGRRRLDISRFGVFYQLGRRSYGVQFAWPFFRGLPVIAGGADVTDDFYPSKGFIGYGTQFEVGQGDSPENFLAVGEVTAIDKLVELTTGVVQITHLRSPDATQEKIATLSDASAIRVSGTFVPSYPEHTEGGDSDWDPDHTLLSLRKSRRRNNFRFVLPDEAGLEGSPASAIALPLEGIVTRYMVGPLDAENKVGYEIEITPTRAYYTR